MCLSGMVINPPIVASIEMTKITNNALYLSTTDKSLRVTNMRDELLNACRNGDIKTVVKVIDSTYIEYKDDNGDTALTLASSKGHLEIVKMLLKKGANLNHQNRLGDTALKLSFMSPVKGRANMYNLLLEEGADMELQDDYGTTALITATYNSDVKAIEVLIGKGAKIDHQDQFGDTALIIACNFRVEPIILLFYEKGASMTIKNNKGKSALDFLSEIENLSDKLQSLKEKLILESDLDDFDESRIFL